MKGLITKQNKFSIRAIFLPLFFILFAIVSCFAIVDFSIGFGFDKGLVYANASSQTEQTQTYDLPVEYSLYNESTILNYFSAENRQSNCANLPQNVGNQRQVGICWAFATLTAFESSLYQTKVVDVSENLNFSELGLAYSTQVINRGNSAVSGGTFDLGYEYISSEQGPVYEQAGEANNDSNWLNDNVATEYYAENYYSTAQKANYTALEAYHYPSRSSMSSQDEVLALRNSIKNHIKTYGAVTASIYFDHTQVIDNLSYNFTGSHLTNHTVALVGWDDNYSYTVAGGTTYTGAYIAQNSHGTDFGKNGYFYIMYADTNVEENVAGFIRVEKTNEESLTYNNLENTTYNNQFLTDLGSSYTYSYIEPTTSHKLANIFQLTDVANQYVSRIKVPTVSTAESSNFYVYVISGLSREDVLSNNSIVEALSQNSDAAIKVKNVNATTSDEYLFIANQTGYYTVDLEQEISLLGEYFAIFVEYISGPIYVKANVCADDGLLSKNMTYFSTPSSSWQQFVFLDASQTKTPCILPMYVKTEYVLGTIDYTCQDVQKKYDAKFAEPEIEVNNLDDSAYTISYSLDDVNWSQTIEIKNVGLYTVYFKIEAAFYETAVDSFQISIEQKQIDVIPVYQYKYYGNDDNVIDYDNTGALETPKFSGALTREAGSDAGYYDIYIGSLKIVDNGSFMASNYLLVFGDGVDKYEIKPRPLYVVANYTSKVYGEDDPVITYQYSNHIETPKFSGTLSRVAGEDVTSYSAVQNNLMLVNNPESGFDVSNYELVFNSQDNANKFEITPRPITITPHLEQQKVYGGDDPVFTYDYSNVLDGQTPVFDGAMSREDGEDVGSYRYKLGTLSLIDNGLFLKNNYKLELSNDDIFFIINYGSLTGCVVEDKEVFYSSMQISLSPQSQTIDGVTISYSLNNNSFTQGNISFKDVGTYNIYYKFEKANYNPTVLQATLTIKPFNLIISPLAGQTKIYGNSNSVLTFAEQRTIAGEIPSYSGALSRIAGEDIGKYLIEKGDISLVSTQAFKASNYNLIFDNLDNITYEILPRQITATVDSNQFKTYGYDDPVLTFKFENTLATQAPAYTGCLSRESGEDAGVYIVNIGSLQLTDSDDGAFKASNYTLNFSEEEILFEIKKASITISVVSESTYYGDEVVTSFSNEISGDYVTSDSLDIVYSCEVDKFTLKGNYPISATVQNERAKNNYDITILGGTYTILYKTYQVDFVVLNEVVKTVYVEHFSKLNSIDVPEVNEVGYTFVNWQVVEEDYSFIVFDTLTDEITEDTILIASMQICEYTILLHTNNQNDDITTLKYTIKSQDFDLPYAKKQGYTFEGWYANAELDGERVYSVSQGSYGNKTFYAKWSINTYTISLPQQTAGYSIVYSGELTCEYNSSFEFQIVLEEAYSQSASTILVAYQVNGGESEQILSSDLNCVLQNVVGDTQISIANVEINTYVINFVVDGSVVKTISKPHGQMLSYSEYPQLPSKQNYDQVPPRWSIANGVYEVKQNYDIVASYTPNVYEVKIVTQNGLEASQLITYGESVDEEELRSQLSLNIFEYLVFENSINDIDRDITINAEVQSRIYILYIVLASIGGIILTLTLFFVIRKIKRRKFNWWGYASDVTKFNKKNK